MKTKIMVVNGLGDMLVRIVDEKSDYFIVLDPYKLVASPTNQEEMIFMPLLDFMVEADAKYTVYKSNIGMIVDPTEALAKAYLNIVDKPTVFVPEEKKIIV